MLRRPHYIALGLVILLTLVVLNLPHGAASHLKVAIAGFFLPLFGVSRTSQQLRERAGDSLISRSTLLKENEELRRTNQALQIQAMQAEAVMRENEQFRQLYGWQKQIKWTWKLARVIARDPANWWGDIQIDAGFRDGIQTNMPVITPSGLVGRISAVGLATSQVVLIGSPECKVAAFVEATRDTGVITGTSSALDNSLVTLSFLSSNSNLKPGQRVVTWGEGKVFPPGILIGQVVEDAHQAELGYTEARVKLAADLGQLQEVYVVLK